jgi:predicted nucleic acid-binding protein
VISFDTNVLVYATIAVGDARTTKAREMIGRGMRTGSGILLLQTLAEFSSVAIRKAAVPVDKIAAMIHAWRAVFPVQAADDTDLTAALEAVNAYQLNFWDAMLWASARRAGVRHVFTEDLQDRFALEGVTFVNPFKSENDQLIDEILVP